MKSVTYILVLVALGISASALRGQEVVVFLAQSKLIEMGYDPGPADGFLGARTRGAIREFQAAQGIPQSGSLDDATRRELEIRSTVSMGRLRFVNVPSVQIDETELVRRVNEMPESVKEDFAQYRVLDIIVDIGHIRQLIEDECTAQHENAIGEFYFWGRGIKSSRLSDDLTEGEQTDAAEAHEARLHQSLKGFDGDGMLICTPVIRG